MVEQNSVISSTLLKKFLLMATFEWSFSPILLCALIREFSWIWETIWKNANMYDYLLFPDIGFIFLKNHPNQLWKSSWNHDVAWIFQFSTMLHFVRNLFCIYVFESIFQGVWWKKNRIGVMSRKTSLCESFSLLVWFWIWIRLILTYLYVQMTMTRKREGGPSQTTLKSKGEGISQI